MNHTVNMNHTVAGTSFENTPETAFWPQEGNSSTGFTDEATEAPLQDICQTAYDWLEKSYFYWFFYSLAVVIGLGFIIHRKALCLNCCYGRPGFLQPIDFIEEIGRRWAYAAVFVIVAYDIIDLFRGLSFWGILDDKDKEWMKKFGWVRVFTKLLDALSLCLVHYPLLAYVDHRRSIIANILGFIHVIPWIGIYSKLFDDCRIAEQTTTLGSAFFLSQAVAYIAYFVVGFSYVLDFALNINRWRKQRASVQAKKLQEFLGHNRNFKTQHHFEYVAYLLRRREKDDGTDKDKGVKLKLKEAANRVKYDKILGFRYSTRIICCIAICTAMLAWFVAVAVDTIDGIMEFCLTICDEVMKSFLGKITFVGDICEGLIVVRIVAYVSTALSALMIVLMLIHTLVTYKRRWHQLIRGDHSWHMYGNKINTPSSTLLSALKFSGYQVAFVIWGWVVLTLCLFVALMFAAFAFVIPLKKGVRNWLLQKLLDIWPSLVLGIIIIPLIQKLICRFAFLQDKGAVMAITNRRVYNATSYYFLVLNIVVGIFSCLKRIVIPLVLGIAFLSRLDQPLIMPGYETMDPGYVAFVSMLLVDLYHNHPVVKVFVELLIQTKDNQLPTIEGQPDADIIQEKRRRSRRIRNRWMKIITLSNNPSLALKAVEQRLIFERDQASKQISQDATKIEDGWKVNVDSRSILEDGLKVYVDSPCLDNEKNESRM